MALQDRLPPWATHEGENRHGMPIIAVDTHAAYPAIIEDYRALYDARTPPEWNTKEGDLRKEWQDALEELFAEVDQVSAYWLEVVYQTAKLDVIVASGQGFAVEIRMKDPGQKFKQADRARGRGPNRAAGGVNGGREAREHYKRLRGFLPA